MFGRSKKLMPSVTYLAEGSDFQGNLRVQGGLRVDGAVRGTVEVNGDLEISATGSIEGPEVKAGNIIIHGTVKASIVAEGSLTLTRTSRLEGDVVVSALNIEAGAFYVGHIVTKDANLLPVAPPIPKLVGRSE
ncbi:MAG: polymer-forming cytoskeletal protein [Limnothrix sp.]|jgi:cytoskeletal protein CcmA (bactofilin family)|uniref:bactofilin family protein n=2 Tax=Limnothrix TaxID=132605 RepID=UPI00081F1B43|nr:MULTISPECIES: polymer-forming cytoskeletal protein [unclassified Limnothrix]MBD2192928.1 polymer-forming cytoskeletal protein [Limnothrix sp. FACHB-1088]MEB3118919.1 polymer-forming cytoskeletal protein [Limnothrix sp.]OCQ96130.1 cell shape determination protein CcmA [Limnothrix sp. P13C2]MBD2162036.1 polymer-forming cytoskeletal protein [Limnothrix sp. FACHB-1083]MBD2554251.1 polymer-forming cytoskeletal protein [Limnothrix sp. FACHB-708]